MGESTRRLNAESIPTGKVSARWERSTVWAVLRNPAYRGVACFGQTRVSRRTRGMRPQRRRGVTAPNVTVGHQRPRAEWIEIPLPALVTEESLARAPELLQENKIRSRRQQHRAQCVAGVGQLSEVWLRLGAHIDVHERAPDPLRPVQWLR
jgi:site-specific DNA recombinase